LEKQEKAGAVEMEGVVERVEEVQTEKKWRDRVCGGPFKGFAFS
jgi:hypothetical protein